MNSFAVSIDRKLCLTAAFIGAMTRKDLAAAFHKANPRTGFDLERAHKWLQGRARPRGRDIYDDWALVIGLDRPGDWIADCELGDFVDALAATGVVPREQLLRRAEAFAGEGARGQAAEGAVEGPLVGRYLCYSHAWSPYFENRLIRGLLALERGATGGIAATYREALPGGALRVTGSLRALPTALHLDLADEGRAGLLMSLFPATPPVSVLGGLLCGPSVLSAEPQPSVTRIALIRTDADRVEPASEPGGAYLAAGASVAADLAEHGVPVGDPEAADRLIHAFLASDSPGRGDRAPIAAYRDLVAFFDAEWVRRAERSR